MFLCASLARSLRLVNLPHDSTHQDKYPTQGSNPKWTGRPMLKFYHFVKMSNILLRDMLHGARFSESIICPINPLRFVVGDPSAQTTIYNRNERSHATVGRSTNFRSQSYMKDTPQLKNISWRTSAEEHQLKNISWRTTPIMIRLGFIYCECSRSVGSLPCAWKCGDLAEFRRAREEYCMLEALRGGSFSNNLSHHYGNHQHHHHSGIEWMSEWVNEIDSTCTL